MSIIPIIGIRMMLQVLLRAGFIVVRQVGSHLRLYHPLTKRSVTLAMHAGDLSRKMISTILKQAGLTAEVLLKLLRKTCRPSIPAQRGGALRGRHQGCFSGRGVRRRAHSLLWPFIHGLTPVAFWLTPVNNQKYIHAWRLSRET